MAEAGIDQRTKSERGASAGKVASRVVGALLVIVAIATFQFLLVLFLTFASWKAAVGAEVLALAVAILVWKRRTVRPWLRPIVIGAILLSVLGIALMFRPTWTAQADHDARLSTMVDELCDTELPADSDLDDCDGSISNTGNGNSCRYLTSAVVNTDDRTTAVASLRDQGFGETSLNVFGEVMDDGRTYLVDGESLRVFLQSSWQDDEGDLRCQ